MYKLLSFKNAQLGNIFPKGGQWFERFVLRFCTGLLYDSLVLGIQLSDVGCICVIIWWFGAERLNCVSQIYNFTCDKAASLCKTLRVLVT